EGWVENLGAGATRYDNGQTGQACRLDNTGENVIVHFYDEPGQVKYYLKGQPASGGWNGTFVIEESADGVNYTPLRTMTNVNMPTNNFTQFTDNPDASSRYIRFRYAQKIAGNVALDEAQILLPAPGDEQEIHVQYNGTGVPSGSLVEIGNATTSTFEIQNLGLQQSLSINSITLSGADAAQFSLSNIPTSVAPSSSQYFTLHFDGEGEGSKFAVITIANNDANENPYIINVSAVAGSLASEPTAQASSLTFSDVTAWDFNVTINGGSASYYLVLRKKGSAPTGVPVDGQSYVKGEWIGDAQIVHAGPAGTFNARHVEAATTYHFKCFAFNGNNGFENYLTTNPLTNSVTTPNGNSGTTFNNVNPNSNEFVGQLSQAINPPNYNQVFYSNYIGTIIDEFYVKDTVQNAQSMNTVECQYSGYHAIYPAGFQFNSTGFSREHCYPQSWMPTSSMPGFENSREYSDLHILLPTKQNEVNAVRSNYPYGDVVSNTSAFLNAKFGMNADNQRVYEPQDKIKGDVARAVMYHATKYTTASNDFSLPEYISPSIPYGQDEYTLKKWHFNDLPDNFEVARNEYVHSKQNNRNPYIDHPQFACYVRFSNMTRWTPEVEVNGNTYIALDPGVQFQWYQDGVAIPNATDAIYHAPGPGNYTVAVKQFEQCPLVSTVTTGINEWNAVQSLKVYPNPSQGAFRVQIDCNHSETIVLRITALTGETVKEMQQHIHYGTNYIDLDLDLAKGMYLLETLSAAHTHTTRLVIN
ncbi:MAG TPA: endonuclease, partial [Flavobacteriales bacterium]